MSFCWSLGGMLFCWSVGGMSFWGSVGWMPLWGASVVGVGADDDESVMSLPLHRDVRWGTRIC